MPLGLCARISLASFALLGVTGCGALLGELDADTYDQALAEGHAEPLPRAARKAARDWFKRQGLDENVLSSIPASERAARLNQAIYHFCENGTAETPADMTELYRACKTACGGISYVLRGALEATGLRTRYAHLYNIPNQGNHTAVEVDLGNGRWGFFDPTFGTYFTHDGKLGGSVKSLTDIAASQSQSHLAQTVHQAPNEAREVLTDPLGRLYNARFDHPYMSLQNYRVAEVLSYDDPREWMILDIDLRLENGSASLGDFDAQTIDALSSAWLRDTNALLLNADLTDDVSYNASRLWATRPHLTTLSLSPARQDQVGQLDLVLFNSADVPTDVQILPLGKSVRIDAHRIISLHPGRNTLSLEVTAQESKVQLGLKNLGPVPVVHLFGTSVEMTSP